MNQLAIIAKHIRGIDEAYHRIKTRETQKKANDMIVSGMTWWPFLMGLGGVPDSSPNLPYKDKSPVVGESGASVGTETVGGASVVLGVEKAVEGQGMGKDEVLRAFENDGVVTSTSGGVTTVYPKGYVFSKEEAKVEGDVGDTGTFYTETVVAGPAVEAPKEKVGGWPVSGEIEVIGLAPNRRMLRGRLGDGRVVNMERTIRVWKAADKVVGKLVRAGASPLYRVA